MKLKIALVLAAAASASGAQAATTFDLAGSFGTSVFTYGQVDEIAGGAITPYAAIGACVFGENCYKGDTQYKLVGYRSGETSITLHPGPHGGGSEVATLVAFLAPTTGTYSFTGSAFRVDYGGGDGMDVSFYLPDGSLVSAGSLFGAETLNLSRQVSLLQGQSFGIAVANRGTDFHDSTGLRGAFSLMPPAVPEPTTWAMMLLGFGFIGGAMRARRRQKFTVSYA